jgi:hypothetical protein
MKCLALSEGKLSVFILGWDLISDCMAILSTSTFQFEL